MRAMIMMLALFAFAPSLWADENPSFACLAKLSTDPRFEILKNKVSLVGAPSFAMLADASSPTDVERAAISAWADARIQCYEYAKAWENSHYIQPMILRIRQAQNKGISLTADLFNGQITYGEFNKRRSADNDAFLRDMASMNRQMDIEEDEDRRGARRQQDARDAEYRRSIERIENGLIRPRSTETNCSWVMNEWRCLSK